MGLYPNFDKPVPEGRPLPRKRGLARYWEILSRDLWDIFRAGFLALAGSVPFLLGLAFSMVNTAPLLAPVLGLLGGLIAGPELCGLADTILRALRDEPGFWWHIYKRAWRRNARASLLPGALGGALLASQALLLCKAGALGIRGATVALLTAGILLVLGLSLYVWPQIALMELRFPQVLKNATLLFIAQLPRSLGALVLTVLYWGAVLWFFPVMASLLPLTNFWLTTLPALFLIYPGIDEAFQIEETDRKSVV